MRLSASQTFKFGPINITVSKSGLSFSLGVPGARASINSQGDAGIRLGAKGFSFNKKKKLLPSISDVIFPTEDK